MSLRVYKKSGHLHVYPDFSNDSRYLTFSLGNRKLSSRVLIFSLPAGASWNTGGTCPQTCPGCYALKTERIFPSARESRRTNLELLQDYGPEVISLAIARILAYHGHRFDVWRIHEGGDVYSARYAWALRAAGALLQDHGKAAYTYTKTEYAPILEPAVNVVRSILPNGELNYGPESDLDAKRARAGLSADDPTCPATLGHDVTCGHDCTFCHHMQYVLFVQH